MNEEESSNINNNNKNNVVFMNPVLVWLTAKSPTRIQVIIAAAFENSQYMRQELFKKCYNILYSFTAEPDRWVEGKGSACLESVLVISRASFFKRLARSESKVAPAFTIGSVLSRCGVIIFFLHFRNRPGNKFFIVLPFLLRQGLTSLLPILILLFVLFLHLSSFSYPSFLLPFSFLSLSFSSPFPSFLVVVLVMNQIPS